MLRFESVCVGMMQENCYIIYEDSSSSEDGMDRAMGEASEPASFRDCVLVDPGDEAGRIAEACRLRELKPSAILLTHGHFDHIGAVPGLLDIYGDIPVYAYEKEALLLSDAEMNLSAHFHKPVELPFVRGLSDGEELKLLGHKLRLIATPGHTAGSCCYYFAEDKLLFAGDTLFRLSYGRTDLPTSMDGEMPRSLDKLFELPEDTKVCPGHGEMTEIGFERANNPIHFDY